MPRQPNKPIPPDIGETVGLAPDSPTGLIRLKSPRPQQQGLVGKPVGSASVRKHQTYYRFSVGGRANTQWFWNHRVIYYLHYGVDPGELEVDFIDGDTSNLNPLNLRLVDKAQQMWNQQGHEDPLVPIKGIRIKDNGTGKKYIEASFNVRSKRYSKTFTLDLMDDAIEWIRLERHKQHGEYTRHTSYDPEDPTRHKG